MARPSWREGLDPYAQPHVGRALLALATSVAPYIGLCVLQYLLLDVSTLLALALAIPAAGFLLRTFMMFHDCAHGAFLPSRRANACAGAVLGLLVYSPFASWRHSHAVHHADGRRPRPPWRGRRLDAHRRGVPGARGSAGWATACSATRW